MKKILLALILVTLTAGAVVPVRAETRTYTERECSTDSYGNTTCHDKTTNVETGVITYSNRTVNGVVDGSVITTGGTVTGNGITILNTALPSGTSIAAGVIVALGGASMALKKLLQRTK